MKKVSIMKKKAIIFLVCIVGSFLFAFASRLPEITVPSKIQKAFKKKYSGATQVIWAEKENYYVADFMADGFQKTAWFNANAQWKMTLTDWETLDQLPPIIYNSFTLGTYSNWNVENVTLAEFPNCPTMVVIKVGQYNIDVQYQLFYSKDGLLLHVRNVSYISDSLSPGTFGCQ